MYAEMDEGEEASAQDLLGNVWPARGYPLPYLAMAADLDRRIPTTKPIWELLLLRACAPRRRCCTSGKRPATGRLPGKADRDPALLRRLRPDSGPYNSDHVRQRSRLRLPDDGADQLLREAQDATASCPQTSKRASLVSLAEARELPRRTHALRGRLQPRLQRGRRAAAAGGQLPPHARRRRLAHARARTPAADAHQHDRRRRRRGGELALLPGLRAGARLPDRPVGQALRARARRPHTRKLPTRCSPTPPTITQPNGYLPMLGATATTYMPGQDPERVRADGRRRPRIRLRLHPRRARARRRPTAPCCSRSRACSSCARRWARSRTCPTRPTSRSTRAPIARATPTSTRWG